MKKLIAVLAAVVGITSLSYGQGTVSLNNGSSAFFVTTNTGTGVSGNAGTGAGSYYYALLVSSYGGATPTAVSTTGGANQFSSTVGSAWTFSGIMGTNNSLTKGGITSPAASVMAAGIWDGPTTASYSTGTIRYYEVLGWSANEGASWGVISNSIATGSWAVTGVGSWFGVSAIGFNSSGGGTGGQPTVSIFTTSAATGISGSGLTAPLVLSPVTPTPEPGTMALAALGGASLLLFRRRK